MFFIHCPAALLDSDESSITKSNDLFGQTLAVGVIAHDAVHMEGVGRSRCPRLRSSQSVRHERCCATLVVEWFLFRQCEAQRGRCLYSVRSTQALLSGASAGALIARAQQQSMLGKTFELGTAQSFVA